MAGMRLKGRASPPETGPVFQRVAGLMTPMGSGHVRRHLPRSARRRVGAWCFLDRFGPSAVPEGASGGGVGPHPHVGLATVTWLLSGEMIHHDSLGTVQPIRAGQLNWMTAGRGIAHAELGTPGPQVVDGVQLWVALPPEDADLAPAFAHHADLPCMREGGCELTVFVGRVGGLQAPTETRTPLVGADLVLPPGGRLTLPLDPDFEHAVLLLQGEARAQVRDLDEGELVYLGMGRSTLELDSRQGGRVLLIGGTPLEGEMLMWWNFVGWSADAIAQAQADWNAGHPRYGEVPESGLPRIPAPPL